MLVIINFEFTYILGHSCQITIIIGFVSFVLSRWCEVEKMVTGAYKTVILNPWVAPL